MISKQLLNYIEKEDKLGKSKKEIKEILLSAGWHKDAVSDAFDIYYKKEKKIEEKIEITIKPEEKELAPETEIQKDDADEGLTLAKDRGQDPHEEDKKLDKIPTVKVKKGRVRSVFLYILFLVVGAGVMAVASFFFYNYYNRPVEQSAAVNTDLGQQEQKVDDARRISEVLKVQEELEKYYNEYKSYPEDLNSLTDILEVSSELNYAYSPMGSPPQSYTLSIEMKSTEDGEFKVESGFMTLKNKQGTK